MKTTEKQMREQAASQFKLQSHKRFLPVLQRLPNFKDIGQDELKETTTTAIVLAESFDDDDYRLHRGRSRVQLLIVQDHTAVVPAECLELENGHRV